MPILREAIVIALPAAHRLAQADVVPLADLRGDAFVSSDRHLGQGFHDRLVQLCEAAGFMPHIVQQARQLQTLIALVAAGFGVALLPASMFREARDDVVFRPVQVSAPDALRYIELCMVWHARSPSIIRDALISEIMNALAPTALFERF